MNAIVEQQNLQNANASVSMRQAAFNKVCAEVAQNSLETNMSVQDLRFMRDVEEQYGFEAQEINVMLKIRKAIDEKYSGLSQAERDALYTLLMGSFVYGDEMIDIFKWSITIGRPEVSNAKWILFIDLGISESDYDLLRYKIRLQNQILSSKITIDLFEEMEVNNLNSWYHNYKEKANNQVSFAEFKQFMITFISQVTNKSDFAHHNITLSTLLYSEVGRDVLLSIANTLAALGGERGLELAGWLGDATLPGKNGQPSFGNDDYIADLDAANLYELQKQNPDLSISEIDRLYRAMLNAGQTRAEIFLKYNNIYDVRRKIFHELFPSYIWGNTTQEEMDKWMKRLKDEYPDTYNFIKNLENNENYLKDYYD